MKRSINVIDLENRIQNNLNPSIKCKVETKEPTEEIKPHTRIDDDSNNHPTNLDNHNHPSYDDENDWIWEYFDDDSFGYEKEEKEEEEEEEDFGEIDDDDIGICTIPQDEIDFIKQNPDFIPSCIYDYIKDGKLYLNNNAKDVMDMRKWHADLLNKDENEKRKSERITNNGYAFADINALSKKVPYIKPDKLDNKEYENVNHPQHYNNYSKEVIDMMVDIFGKENTIKFCEMNAFKYRMRMGNKPGNDINQDLEKEQWYLNKAIDLRHSH